MKNQYKNTYHIEPEKGLLNDPNGLIQYQGRFYFFHQWNRFSTNHEYKEWGLFTSNDLVNWKNEGSAILPDSIEDKDGIYSGSAIEHNQNMYLFYTGNTKISSQRKSYQKIAISKDGKTFIKQKNRVETPSGFSEHHRDPKVWKKENEWWMIVGAQTVENQGAITLFKSSNLVDWFFKGIFYKDPILDQMCECPDYFSLSKEIDLLIVCPQKRTDFRGSDVALSSYAGYLTGKLDEKTETFVSLSPLKKLDYGFDFYAPQSFKDDKGRRIIVAWMSRMDEAEETQCPTISDGYVHCLTMPRQLIWKNNQLCQVPLIEYRDLRKESACFQEFNNRIENYNRSYEIVMTFDEEAERSEIKLNSETTLINYSDNQLEVGRINWVSQAYESTKVDIGKLYKLQIFCDNSTVEVFVNDGEYVFSMRVFTKNADRHIEYSGLNTNGSFIVYNY